MGEKTFSEDVIYGGTADTCIEYDWIGLNSSQIIKHGLPSLGLPEPSIEISEVNVSLLKKWYGGYAVELHTDQNTRKYEAYNSSLRPKQITSSYNMAKEIYEGLVKIIKEDKLRLHVFPDLSIGIEEVKESKDIREILA